MPYPDPTPSRLGPARRPAADLDRFLGDPRTGSGPFSYHEIVEAEERDELPAGALEAIREWGFQAYLVPEAAGGRLTGLEELYHLCRTLSRRNVTIAVAYGSALLAVNPVWLWGREDQRKTVAQAVLDGAFACFGVSEADHGSDLRACEAVLADGPDGSLLLSGAKWPVGNATRGRFVTAFARAGERDFSMVLVDKEAVDPARWSTLPFVKTVGLRGHDLSGVVFDEVPLARDAVLGRPGAGLTQVLKTLQITRTAISALSVGTADTALRIALEYAHERELYGGTVYRIPAIRDQILSGYVDLMIAECTALPVTRALNVVPGRMSLWSCVVKYLVPVMAEEVVASMGRVLGARSYLREGVADGVFQKLQRDHAIASIFDGTTHVNLHAVADQLPFVARRMPSDTGEEDLGHVLESIFSWTRGVPRWEPDGMELQLTNEGSDEITQRWPIAVRLIRKLAAQTDALPNAARIAELVELADEQHAAHYKLIANWGPMDVRAKDPMAAAIRHCELHAIASCVYTWLVNREVLGGDFAAGGWLVLCLERLLRRMDPRVATSEPCLADLEAHVLGCLADTAMFSLATLASGAG